MITKWAMQPFDEFHFFFFQRLAQFLAIKFIHFISLHLRCVNCATGFFFPAIDSHLSTTRHTSSCNLAIIFFLIENFHKMENSFLANTRRNALNSWMRLRTGTLEERNKKRLRVFVHRTRRDNDSVCAATLPNGPICLDRLLHGGEINANHIRCSTIPRIHAVFIRVAVNWLWFFVFFPLKL